MHFNPYGGPAAELAAVLATKATEATGAGPADHDELASALRDHGLAVDAGGLGPDDVRRLLAWGRRLRPAFGASTADRDDPVGGLVDTVNGLLADSACRPYVSRHDGRPPHLHYADEHADLPDRVAAFTAAGVAAALCDDHRRLGHCDRPGCTVVYVDTSRNGRRRFCSARCANQWHVARHRARDRSAVGADAQ